MREHHDTRRHTIAATSERFLTQKAACREASVSITMSCIRLIHLTPVNVAICHVIGTTLLVFPVFLMRPVEGVKDRTYNATAPRNVVNNAGLCGSRRNADAARAQARIQCARFV